MKPFTEEDRYLYNLTPDSIVLDCGGYEGRWARGISERYGCTVHVLEPVRKFFNQTVKALLNLPKVHVHNCGIGAVDGVVKFSIKGDMTGKFADNPESEWVNISSVEEVFKRLNLEKVDLLKLNIEGSEYDVLERLLDTGLIDRIHDFQVQWHDVVPGAEMRRASIISRLEPNRHLTFDHGWVWQNWRANT